MLTPTKIQVRSLSLDRLVLSWEATESTEDPQDFDVYVERSGSPGGDFVTITSVPLVDTYVFVDVQRGLLHQWAKLYYRLRVVRRRSGETAYFPDLPVRLQARPPLDGLEMSRQELVMLKEFTGRKCWLFKRRTFGARCPECWNARTFQRTKSHCKTCWDTSFLGGYHRPIEFYCQIDPHAQAPQISAPLGEQQQENTTARTIFFPPVDPRDIIVEAENIRWIVNSRTYTERARAPVKQEFQMHRIPEADIEYALPVNVDLLNLDPTAVRQYSNPVNPAVVPAGLEGFPSSAVTT